MKVQIICKECETPEIMFDAYAVWSVKNQRMELMSTYDHTVCGKCGAEDSSIEVPIDE